MTLSPAFLDELRARTALSGLIGRAVKLQKAGREWKACCPFHNEKTPSFTVNDDKGFYHCFGCGAHGDAIRWLTDARGLPFLDAVKELADAAGMEVPAPDPSAQERSERARGLYDVMAAAASWFRDQLSGIEGAAARLYLDRRGIDQGTRTRFGFGYAPDASGKLKSALASFGADRLVEAGLLAVPDDGREPYDRFRGRLMIPIADQRGRVIAFGGRTIGNGPSTGSGPAKYLNSPETALFDKSRTLFNIDKAGPASRSAGRLIVAEGYLDVIALDAAGFGEAVAPLGTALTEGQLERLWRMVPCPILCFDGDSAGQKAAARAALRALPHVGPGRSLAFVTLPAGQDPDDLLRAQGAAAMRALLEAPEPLVDRLWRHEMEAEPLATPEAKAGLRRRLLDRTGAIGDPNVREQYRAELMRRFNALTRPSPPSPWSGGGPRRTARPSPFSRGTSAEARALGSAGLGPRLGRAVLAGLLRYPELIAPHAEAVAALRIGVRDAERLRDILLEAALAHGELDQERLHTILSSRGAAALAGQLGSDRELAFSFIRRDAEPERARRDLVLVMDTLAARPGLDAALDAATARLKEGGEESAFLEQQRLRAARDEADRRLAALIEADAG